MKKKVLIIHTKYRNFGGEDANIIEEVNLLKKRYEVRYLEFDNNESFNFFDLFSFFFGSNYRSNRKLIQNINNFKPDIAYVHNTWYKAGLGIFKELKKANIKTVLKIHNFRYNCTQYFLSSNHLKGTKNCNMCGFEKKRFKIFNKYFQNSYLKSIFVVLYGKRYTNILKKNDFKIVVLNKFHKQHLSSLGVKREIDILYNPIEIKVLSNKEYNPESKSIVYAGQLSKEKGIYNLLEIWSKFENNDLKLNLIGSKNLLDEQKLKEYDLSNVNFLGQLNNNETMDHISNSRAVVTLTRMYEGQPRLLCEASALGIPSIYPSFGGMDEYYPKDYQLKFIQYDYRNFEDKLKLIFNKEFLMNERKKIYGFFKNNFNNDKLILKYMDILEK